MSQTILLGKTTVFSNLFKENNNPNCVNSILNPAKNTLIDMFVIVYVYRSIDLLFFPCLYSINSKLSKMFVASDVTPGKAGRNLNLVS